MDTTILVEKHILDGKFLLENLFKRKWKVIAAFWNQDQDSLEWKLFMSVPLIKKEGTRAIYLRLTNAIREITPRLAIDVDDIKLIDSKSNVVQKVKSFTAKDNLETSFTKNLYLSEESDVYGQTICYIPKNIKGKKNKNSKKKP